MKHPLARAAFAPRPLARVIVASALQDPLRAVLAVLAIALGVALGFAVQIINATAVNELTQGVRAVSGDADLQVRGPRAGFDEDLYPRLAARPDIAVASPIVEVDARIAGTDETLRVLGVDLFRAAEIAPGLLPRTGQRTDLLDPDVLFLSARAMDGLRVREGEVLRLQSGAGTVALRVAGAAGPALLEPAAVMDIAGVQEHFARLGVLTRIDLRVAPGADTDAVARSIAGELPAGLGVSRPETTIGAGASLSRAYRVNLDVLALVALFTGGLLVFSTQALGIVRRRAQLALLRVLGITRGELVLLLVGEGVVLGLAGSVLGLALGYGLAGLALHFVGTDLGSGYFRGVAARPVFEPWAALGFALLGTGIAAAGSAVPAREAGRAAPAQALKAGDEQRTFTPLRRAGPGMGALVAGGLATLLPPVHDLPLFGYFSIALLLIGTLMLLPTAAVLFWSVWPTPRRIVVRLALAQLQGAPGQASVSLASIVASVSLMVAMGIMVYSFRTSLEAWLQRVLPADVYVRASPSGDSGFIPEDLQRRIAALRGVQRVDFLRDQQILLDPARPRIVLIARELDPDRAADTLPLIEARAPASGAAPAWINEAIAALYGLRPGDTLQIPLRGAPVPFVVQGVWRDYARQQGAIVIERARYIAATGDRTANNAAIWVRSDASADGVMAELQAIVPPAGPLEVGRPGAIRRASLRAFDRTFAVTYALEFAAVAIGLVGLSSAFGALVLARRREFGMLRHVGALRREIAGMLAMEGLLVSSLGMAVGVTLGVAMSLVLINVVNRQSFHWGMDLAIPWLPLLAGVGLVLLLSMGTAVVSGRAAMSAQAIRAVREDW